MTDNRKINKHLQELAILYQEEHDNKVLTELVNCIESYLMKKTINGITNNISLKDRRDAICTTITNVYLKIDTYDLKRYTFPSVLTMTFKHILIGEYRRLLKLKFVPSIRQFDTILEKKQHRDYTIF